MGGETTPSKRDRWSGLSRLVCRTLAASRGPDVSARVRRRVQEQQAESEILVGWVQLGIVLFLGCLYAVSPKTVPADLIAPVPWAVAGYLSFTLLRLADAHRRVLPGWLTTLSCIVDVGLLLVLIWTFDWQ